MAYQGISLGDIVQQAGAIKGQQQRSQLADLQIQEAQKQRSDQEGIDSALTSNPNASLADLVKAGGGMAGVQASTQVGAARTADLTNHYRQTYTAANQVANSDNPLQTIQQVAPQFPQQFDSVHGQGAFAQLAQDPTKLKAAAAQVAQDSLAGLVDPDKQFQAHQTMIENHYKQEGPGGELARNQNTIAGENARAQFVQGQENNRAALTRAQDRKPQLVEVPMPDGTVQKQWIVPGATAGTNVGTATNPTTGMGMGRIQQMVGRITLAGNEVSRSAQNLMEMNAGANAGLFGIGKDQGHGIMNSVKSALANTMSDEDTKSYNIKVAGVTRNLAAIEAAGNMPPGSLTSQMSAVVAQPGDTDINRLERMAEIRQIADAGLESIVTQPGISQKQVEQIEGIRAKIAKSIPFTQHDVLELKQSKDPNVSLASLAKARGLGGQSTTPSTHPAPIQALLDKYSK